MKIKSLAELREKAQGRPENVSRIMSRYVYRPISIFLTYFFVRVNLSANAVTLISVIPGFLGFYFLTWGTPVGYFWGSFMMVLFLLIDYCDGEVARYTDDQTMTGLFIELFAHYFINMFIFFGFAFGIYKQFPSVVVFYIALMGFIGVTFSKVKSLLTWQVVCIEYLRENSRMLHRNSNVQYKAKTLDAQPAPAAPSPVARKPHFLRQIFKKMVNPAVDDSNNINMWFALAVLNLFLPRIPVPYLEPGISIIEIFFVFCCFVNFMVMSVFTYRHIKYRTTERAYDDLFVKKSANFDFYFY